MNKSKVRLFPCAFCGGDNVVLREKQYEVLFRGACRDCGALGPALGTIPAAVEAWNKRRGVLPVVGTVRAAMPEYSLVP